MRKVGVGRLGVLETWDLDECTRSKSGLPPGGDAQLLSLPLASLEGWELSFDAELQ